MMADNGEERFYVLIPATNEGRRWKNRKELRTHFSTPRLNVSGDNFGELPVWIGDIIGPMLRNAGATEPFVCLGPLVDTDHTSCLLGAFDTKLGHLGPITRAQEERMEELWGTVRHQTALLQPIADEVRALNWRTTQDRQKLVAMKGSWPEAAGAFDHVIGELDHAEGARRIAIETAARPRLENWHSAVNELAGLLEGATRKDVTLQPMTAADIARALVSIVKAQPICLAFPQWAV